MLTHAAGRRRRHRRRRLCVQKEGQFNNIVCVNSKPHIHTDSRWHSAPGVQLFSALKHMYIRQAHAVDLKMKGLKSRTWLACFATHHFTSYVYALCVHVRNGARRMERREENGLALHNALSAALWFSLRHSIGSMTTTMLVMLPHRIAEPWSPSEELAENLRSTWFLVNHLVSGFEYNTGFPCLCLSWPGSAASLLQMFQTFDPVSYDSRGRTRHLYMRNGCGKTIHLRHKIVCFV